MANSSGKALYLHWGPGGCCEVERKWFGDSLPVVWWDQPAFRQDDARAWPALVEAAAAELKTHAHPGKPVSLIGHSFGGQLALELSHQLPSLVSDITLLNAAEYPPRAFVSLASRMIQRGLGGEGLAQALEAAQNRLSAETFWPLLGEITAVPDFMSLYWGPASGPCREKFFSLATPAKIIDLPSFTAVMTSYLVTPRPRTPSPFPGSVRMITGAHDPLMDASTEIKAWKAHFPRLAEKSVSCGHFTQFEADAGAIFERARS